MNKHRVVITVKDGAIKHISGTIPLEIVILNDESALDINASVENSDEQLKRIQNYLLKDLTNEA